MNGQVGRDRGLMLRRLSTQEIEANRRATDLAFERVAQAETASRQAVANGLRLCAACSVRLVAAELCAHHTARERVDDWAAGNRIWCEFVHGSWRTRQGIATAATAQHARAQSSE